MSTSWKFDTIIEESIRKAVKSDHANAGPSLHLRRAQRKLDDAPLDRRQTRLEQ
jgi:hypothetical protein